MEGQRRTGQASRMDLSLQVHQPRAMDSEGARHLLHHRHIGFQRRGQHPGVLCPGPLLRHAAQASHRHLDRHLHWSFWLRNLRHHASDLRLARGRRLLEHAAYSQDSPGSALAGSEELQAPPVLLVQLHGHVLLRVLSRLHVSVAQFRLNPCMHHSAALKPQVERVD